ncbi:MAG TPA: hypothetical protein VFR21_26000, partial [Bradyrhizobium sp.]|nr:hypothetical protein [Bradyrhizobium sp.]
GEAQFCNPIESLIVRLRFGTRKVWELKQNCAVNIQEHEMVDDPDVAVPASESLQGRKPRVGNVKWCGSAMGI